MAFGAAVDRIGMRRMATGCFGVAGRNWMRLVGASHLCALRQASIRRNKATGSISIPSGQKKTLDALLESRTRSPIIHYTAHRISPQEASVKSKRKTCSRIFEARWRPLFSAMPPTYPPGSNHPSMDKRERAAPSL
jgi:hypothetical protein